MLRQKPVRQALPPKAIRLLPLEADCIATYRSISKDKELPPESTTLMSVGTPSAPRN
jgi:hypothetical protein